MAFRLKLIIYLTTILVIVMASCNNEDKIVTYKSFRKTALLSGKRVGPSNFFKDPFQISIADTILIVNDRAKFNHFYFININNYLVLDSFGRRGKGPKEFLLADMAEKKIKKWTLITLKEKYCSSFFNIDSMMIDNNYFPNKFNVYPTNLAIPYNVLSINDSLMIGQTSSGQCRLFSLNITTDYYKYLKSDITFKGSKKINQADLGQLLYSISDYNENHKVIANTVRMFDQIDLYNIRDLDLDKSIRSSNKNKYEFKGQILTDETFFYYIDLQTTDKYIFGLYCGKMLKDATPNVGNELHVFDWEGKAILKASLDIGLSNILILNNQNLIGIDPLSDQPLILYNFNLD